MPKQKEYKEEDIAAAIGRALKALRKEKGLSQSDIYLAAGIERNTLQKYDSGRVSRPMFSNMIKIAEVLEITPGTIFDRAYDILKENR